MSFLPSLPARQRMLLSSAGLRAEVYKNNWTDWLGFLKGYKNKVPKVKKEYQGIRLWVSGKQGIRGNNQLIRVSLWLFFCLFCRLICVIIGR